MAAVASRWRSCQRPAAYRTSPKHSGNGKRPREPAAGALSVLLQERQQGGKKGSNVQLRRDLTIELVSQLNETLKDKDGIERTKLHRVIKNLITQATTSDEYDEKGIARWSRD